MKHNNYWLGVRESDVADTGDYFSGSITIFGSGRNHNHAMEKERGRRIDHNGVCDGFNDFFIAKMKEIADCDPNVRFTAYDALDYSDFPAELQELFTVHNDYGFLKKLNHKLYTREHFASIVKTSEYRIITLRDFLDKGGGEFFPGHSSFVLQRDFSCGGSGTFLIRTGGAGAEALCRAAGMEDSEKILLSPFFENNISVNIHCVIYEEETLLFAPSLQLVDQRHDRLEYLGSDFSAASVLNAVYLENIRQTAYSVCSDLRASGYRGVCGIDMILAGNECYFMEVNARFQASSALLNRNLVKAGLPALPEYNEDAFSSKRPLLPVPPETAAGSFINLHYRRCDRNRLHWLWERVRASSEFEALDDFIDWDGELEENCYAFQIRSEGAISSLSYQNTIRIHPNVSLASFCVNESSEYDNLFRLKLLLLARGVSVTEKAWKLGEKLGGVDWYEFEAVTLRLPGNVWVTAPCLDKWSAISPLEVDEDESGKRFRVCIYGKPLMQAEMMQADHNAEKKTSEGHYCRDIVYMNPDRLRVYHRDGCIFQDRKVGCRFCDLYGTGQPLSFDEIRQTLDLYWDDLRVDHFLIGGGSGSKEEEYRHVLRIAKYIHQHSDKHIYLMTTPLNDPDRLTELKANGITEISFNIEIFDRKIAAEVMPGKAAYTAEYYLDSLEKAALIFGRRGEVRCAVIVGFDDEKTFADGIRRICKAGAAPILSLYRSSQDAELKDFMPPDENEAYRFYRIARDISAEYGLRPGPTCKACQNNTIALDM